MSRFIGYVSIFLFGTVIGGILYAYAPNFIRSADTSLPVNHVVFSERIHTSGQPSEVQLLGLHQTGYELIINLAPPDTFGSLPKEGGLVANTGLSYINIPVDWFNPGYKEFELFSEILNRSDGRKVLVHCQINKRASLFTFLYRVVHEGIDPDAEYENVTSIWLPEGHWMEFIQNVLTQHNIDFSP